MMWINVIISVGGWPDEALLECFKVTAAAAAANVDILCFV